MASVQKKNIECAKIHTTYSLYKGIEMTLKVTREIEKMVLAICPRSLR